MSKKNNKKNTRKNYKIETLEPRLLMDATADRWLDENSLTDTTAAVSMNNSLDAISAGVSGAGNDLEGLSQQPTINSSNEYEKLSVKAGAVFDMNNVVLNIKNSNDYKNIHDFIENCINECRKDATVNERNFFIAAQATFEMLKNTSGVSQTDLDNAEVLVMAAYNNLMTAWNNAIITTDDLYAKLDGSNSNSNWSFIKNGVGIDVKISGDYSGIEHSTNTNINPDIGESTRLDVNFEDAYSKKMHYELSFTIDGNKNNSINVSVHADVSLGFNQNISQKDAKLGVLELNSIDASESDADYEVKVSLDADENGQISFIDTYNVDLNFELKNSSQLDNDLNLVNASDLLLSGTSITSATWGSNDDILSKIKYVQMGDVLKTLNDICFDLSTEIRNENSDSSSNNFLGNSDLDRKTLDGTLDQSTSSLIDVSKMFDPILKYPPKTLQELVNRLKKINSACTAKITPQGSEYILTIPFKLTSDNSSKVNFSDVFLKRVIEGQTNGYFSIPDFKFDVTEKNALDYGNDSTLSFDMELTLTDLSRPLINSTTKLNDILKDDNYDLARLGKSNVVEVNEISTSYFGNVNVSSPIEIAITSPIKTQSVTISQGNNDNDVISDAILTGLQNMDPGAQRYYDENMIAFEVGSSFDIEMDVVDGNSREIGIYGKRLFEDSYLFEIVANKKINIGGKDYTVPAPPSTPSSSKTIASIEDNFANQIKNLLIPDGYKVTYIKSSTPILLIQRDDGALPAFPGDGRLCKSLVVYRKQGGTNDVFDESKLPTNFKFTIDLSSSLYDKENEVMVNTFDISFENTEFSNCYDIEDVANVINAKLAGFSEDSTKPAQVVFAEIVQEKGASGDIQKLVFRCDSQNFDVTASENVLGYTKGTAVSSTTNSIHLKIDGNDYEVSLYDVLYKDLKDSAGNDLTIGDLLNEIKLKIKSAYFDDVYISANGLTFDKLEQIYDLGGFSLVKALGLYEYMDGKNAVNDVKIDSIDVTNVNLVMENNIKQDRVVAHANMGMLGIDYSGNVDFTAKYENNASDWDEFVRGNKVTWTYTPNATASNNLTVVLSQRMDGKCDCGNIDLFDASNDWDGTFYKTVTVPADDNVMSYLENYGQGVNMFRLVSDVVGNLDKFLKNQILTNESLKTNLPLIGRSATEAFGIQAKITELMSELNRNLPVTLQELSARLSASLGASLTFAVESDGIKVSFHWVNNLNSEKIAISSLSLGRTDIFVGGNAEAYLSGDVELHLDMKVGNTKNAQNELPVTFLDSSYVDVKNVKLNGSPLKFDLSVSTGSQSASLLKVVSTNEKTSSLKMCMKMRLNFDSSSDAFDLTSEDFKIGGKLYVEAAGQDIGSIELGVLDDPIVLGDPLVIKSYDGVDSKKDGLFVLANANNVYVNSPKFKVTDETNKVKGNIALNMGNLEVDVNKNGEFQKLRLVSDGLSSVLRKAQLSTSTAFVSEALRKIPLIGDNIMVAADCFTRLESDFIEPLRKYFYGDHEFDADSVAEFLYDLLQKENLLQDLSACSESNQVRWAGSTFNHSFSRGGNERIQYNYNKGEGRAEWRFCIGGTYTLSSNGDFDIGYPGLGLRGEGGIKSTIEWKWNLGFGVSKEEGAYILLSKGNDVDDYSDPSKTVTAEGLKVKDEKDPKKEILTGDDIQFTINIVPKSGSIDGSLGFLKAGINLDGNSAQTLTLGIDLNDGSNGSEALDLDQKTDKYNSERIKISDLGKALSIETNLTGSVNVVAKLTLGVNLGTGCISIGFPEISAGFQMTWKAKFGDLQGTLEKLGFTEISLNAESFASNVLNPMLGKIKKVLEPLQPLVDFLNMEIPVLNQLPLKPQHIKMLKIIQTCAKGKCDLGFLEDFAKFASLISSLNKIESLGKKLYIGDLDFVNSSNDYDKDALSGMTEFAEVIDVTALPSPLTYSITTPTSYKPSSTPADAKDRVKQVFGLEDNGYGWDIPILSGPEKAIINLLLGRNIELITFRMHPLSFESKWEKNFPIIGPLCADIGFNFGADINIGFGYDTMGLVNWKNSNYKDLWALADGFYIDDCNKDGVDIAEVIFHSGITAGASVAGIAGINVGVNLNLNLNFDDPNNDGKIRLQELARNLSLNPMTLFDASVTMEAEAFAYINYFIGRDEFDLWKSGAIELFNTDRGDADNPILISKQDGDAYVNVGEYAAKRNKGNLEDGDDWVHINVDSNDASGSTLTAVWNNRSGSKLKQTFKIEKGHTLYIFAGKGADIVTFTSSKNEAYDFNIVIDGGADNDNIDLSGVTLADGCEAIVKGGLGSDSIVGAIGKSYLFGESGYFTIDENDKKVKEAFSYPEMGNVSENKIIAKGSTGSVIFGGAGVDHIFGSEGDDIIFGDGGYYGCDDVNSPEIIRYDIFDVGGGDIIDGLDGKDVILGGAGNDKIRGGKGDDEIHGGLGDDLIIGDEGNDKLYGYDGIDVIFGDGFNITALQNTFPDGYGPENDKYVNRTWSLSSLQYDVVSASNKDLTKSQATALGSSAASANYGDDWIEGNDGSDVIFGDSGENNLNGGNDIIAGGTGNDLIDGDGGNDNIDGGVGEDVIYGGQGNDVLDGGADNDVVFGDDGLNGFSSSEKGNTANGLYRSIDNFSSDNERELQKRTFGQQIGMFAKEFGIGADAKSQTDGGSDIIYAGNGSDIIDGQSGNDSYKIRVMDNGHLGYTNVMDTGVDSADSMTIDGSINDDLFLIRASTQNLGFVAKLPDPENSEDQIQRINYWKKNSATYTGIENIALNTGAGDDKIAIDGTISTISIDAGAGNDNVAVGQLFNSERTTDVNLSNVLPNDVFGTTLTTKGYLSNGVQHSTNIEGGEGNDTFNVLHNDAAISLSGGTGNDTFNVSMYQKIDLTTNTKTIVENSPVTLIGGAGIDRMNIVGSDGDDDFVMKNGKILGNGIDVQTVSIENRNVYGSDGDDSFYVLDTAAGEVTKLFGNKGNDSFYNGGAGKSQVPTVSGNTRNSDPNAIEVVFYTPGETEPKDTAISAVTENYPDGYTVDPNVYNYQVSLSKPPQDGEIVNLTIFAPVETTEKTNRGDKGIWLLNESDELCKSITIRFENDNGNTSGVNKWNDLVNIRIVAFEDSVQEGNDYFCLLHNRVVENKQSSYKDCKNAIVFLNDAPIVSRSNTVTNQFCTTQEHVVSSEEATGKEFTVTLHSENPSLVECWFLDENGRLTPVDATNRACSGDKLTVTLVDPNAVGKRYYISYANDKISVENESVIQMKYSTTGMTAMLDFMPEDGGTYQICAESQKGQYENDNNVLYYYKTAGTQLVIYSMASGKLFALNGTVVLPSNVDVFVPDEPDVLNAPTSNNSSSNGKNTIEFIKGPLYEDGAGREANLGLGGPMMLWYNEDDKNEDDKKNEKNEISSDLQNIFDAAAAAAAKFDEGDCKDRVFINNQDNEKEGVENTLQALEDVGVFDESLIAAGVNSADVVNSNDTLVKQSDTELFDSDKHSLRFVHQDAGATGKNELTLANMEYGEINLGQDKDQVDIHKTIYREDNFQTYTVVNSGKGNDNVNVHSYAEETADILATMDADLSETTYDGSLQNVVAYSVSNFRLMPGVASDKLSLIKSFNDGAKAVDLLKRDRVFLNVEYSDGSVQRREVVLDEYDGSPVTTLIVKRKLTPVAEGVTIKSVYLANMYFGDGQLVVNAQSGTDTINAMGDNDENNASMVTREGLVVIGGTGDDTINVNTNVIAFGDRGQILYKNEKGEVVTRLGSLDVDSSITNEDVLDQMDYTTPDKKVETDANGNDYVVSNYFQTDGVVRDPVYIHSVSELVGETDVITTYGDKNVVIGGAGQDIIHLNGSNNVAIGDNGEVKFAGSDAYGDTTERVYGDSTKTYLNYVQTTFDTEGDIDEITTGDGNNVVMGGTNSDRIATGNGNDIIIGDGGEAFVDRNREALFVSNQGRNIDTDDNGVIKEDGSAGSDVIKTSGGDNVIFGGLNTVSRDFDFVMKSAEDGWEAKSVDENNNDLIVSGSGKDIVFGDNAYATFKGNHEMANGKENAPEVRDSATLSFNFQGAAQTGLNSSDSVGAEGFATTNWNNISGSIAGAYGNDDREIVRFDDGTRASSISVSYAGIEWHRNTSTDNRINLQAYNLGLHGTSYDANKKFMNTGLMTTAPNNQCASRMEVAVDGLAQYYESYQVAVYLDLPDANSWAGQSVRLISLYIDGVRKQAFYVNDPEHVNFSGTYVNNGMEAVLDANGHIQGVQVLEDGEIKIKPMDNTIGSGLAPSNYVVFDVGADIASDRIVIKIEDGVKEWNLNGKDLPGIAGLQIKGTLHKQDVAASTNIEFGGNDVIHSNCGDDIIVGGTGADKIWSFDEDDRHGINDNDVVFGDNAKLLFTDRDSNENTASTLSTAESISVTAGNISHCEKNDSTGNELDDAFKYHDEIYTGDGNDVVVGGIGGDSIYTNATANSERMMDNINVLSINFTREHSDASDSIAAGEAAGVVVDNGWHNFYRNDRGVIVSDTAYSQSQSNMNAYNEAMNRLCNSPDSSNPYAVSEGVEVHMYGKMNGQRQGPSSFTIENHDEIDGDTSNSKLYNTYIASQQSEEIVLKLLNLNTFVGNSGNTIDTTSYDLYVYLGGDNNDTDTYNYLYQISLNTGDGSPTQYRYLNDWTGHKFDGDYKEAYCTSYAAAWSALHDFATPRIEIIGNYVVFRNVTGNVADIRIKNVISFSGQSPKNLPMITAIQIVSGDGRYKESDNGPLVFNEKHYEYADIAIGGDHDKDLVYGDDAKLWFDLDVPFATDENIANYRNRVIEAKSVAIDQGVVTRVSTNDFIQTGKDRDVVVGGEDGDTIITGLGDDVALGGSANLMVEHNNPLGVFTPNTEIVLDQHTIDLNIHRGYLDNDNTNVNQIQYQLNQNQILGIDKSVPNGNDRYDTIDAGSGRNLTYQSSDSNAALIVTPPPAPTPGPSEGGEGQGQGTGEGQGQGSSSSTGEGQGTSSSSGSGSTEMRVETLTGSPQVLTLNAGETIKLVCTEYPQGNQWWTPNVVIYGNNAGNSTIPEIDWAWDGGIKAHTNVGNNVRIDIPDHPNGANGEYEIYLTAKTSGMVILYVGQG